jgi:hypothetical protein
MSGIKPDPARDLMKPLHILLSLALAISAFGQKESLQRSVGTNVVTGSLSSTPFQVATIASLKVATVTNIPNGTQVSVLGYYAAGDGGGGDFQYSSASVATDNGGTIIQPNVGSGRWLRVGIANSVSVLWFGAIASDGIDDTATIQAALSTSFDIFFPKGTYNAVGLTSSIAQRTIYGEGGFFPMIVKNGNGVILTVTGLETKIRGLTFKGESDSPVFTGDNLSITAEEVAVIDCNSYRAVGRAIKLNGGSGTIRGGYYQTVTSAGYDIEVGVSGTARLYTRIEGIYTSQSSGGILLTDVGSCTVVNSQFGKLTIATGTSPAGVNGGITIGNRILGNVTVGLPGAVFSGNQFGSVVVTFNSGTSGCTIDLSNTFQSGATVVNSGNRNNTIIREVSSGSYNDIRVGADASYTTMRFGQNDMLIPGATLTIDNAKSLYFQQVTTPNTVGAGMGMTISDNFSIGNTVPDKAIQIVQSGSSGWIQLLIGGSEKMRVTSQGAFLGGTTAFDSQGSGSPEGAVTAPVGSTYRRTNGGASTTFYVKESGSGNTGWVAK